MASDHGPAGTVPLAAVSSISVPELRDYHQINSELIRRLNLGARHVRLEGVDGHRLLVAGIAGTWPALVEIDGNAGPELAADMNAPGLTIVCRGTAADGAGRGLQAGSLLLMERAGVALGYVQRGGLIVAAREVGPRAGLLQRGGALVLLDRAGPLAGERQSGGILVIQHGLIVRHAGHARRGGRLVLLPAPALGEPPLDASDLGLIEQAARLARRFQRDRQG